MVGWRTVDAATHHVLVLALPTIGSYFLVKVASAVVSCVFVLPMRSANTFAVAGYFHLAHVQ
eukprot:12248416-Alexandrium_andersonii.AAC.1